ncbi:MAG: hypothetical protein JW787_15440 [Sedimentisphaerales bacterium]|nr:hypothetical protein [Sedimentisphaerales bacterium]
MSDKGEAFVKGGCGCLIAFIVIGLSCVLIGGHMHIDIFGAILLFAIGGVIGLIVLAIYNKGKQDAGKNDDWDNNNYNNSQKD